MSIKNDNILQKHYIRSIIARNKLKKQVDYDECYRESGQVRADAGRHN